MIQVKRSSVDPHWFEVHSGDRVVQEVEVRFSLRFIPKRFDSVESALKWLSEIEKKLAKAKAYRLLAMKSYPSAVLFSKLKEKGFSSSVCDELIKELQQAGWIQDDLWLKTMIEREFQRGYGPRYIEQKLKAKGMNSDLVRELITDSMEKKKIRELISKSSSKEKKKIVASLARKGFSISSILQLID